MPIRYSISLAFLAAALAGCGMGNASSDGAAPTTPEPPALVGVYAGRFPCSNCTAIEATLWLRADGSFVLRQKLIDESAAKPANDPPTYGLGRWHWDEHTAEAVLAGPGPPRRVTVLDTDRLKLLVASPVEHVLERDATAPPFADRIALEGESAVSDKGAVFRECRTGIEWPVADAGAYRELRRQHRRLNPRGKVTLTAVEAHLAPAGDAAAPTEALVVDRVVGLKPGKGC
jgi:copper homeostasis protein (lipoprotein)